MSNISQNFIKKLLNFSFCIATNLLNVTQFDIIIPALMFCDKEII